MARGRSESKEKKIEEAKAFGRKSLEDAKAGRLHAVRSENQVAGAANWVPRLEENERTRIESRPQQNTNETRNTTPSTEQERQAAIIPSVEPQQTTRQANWDRDYAMQQNTARNAQRRAERQPVDILGSRLEAGQNNGLDKYSQKVRPESSFDPSLLSEKDAKRFEKINEQISEIASRSLKYGTSVQDQKALEALQASKAKLMGQNLVSDETNADDVISEWLDPDYKMGKTEVEQAKQIIRDYENTEYKNPNIEDLTDEEAAKLSQINALRDKISKPEAAVYGTINATPGVSALMAAGDNDFYGWSLDQLRDEVARQRDIPMSAETRDYVNQLQQRIASYQDLMQNPDTIYSTGDVGVDDLNGANTTFKNSAEVQRAIRETETQMYKLMLESMRGDQPDYDKYSFRKANAQKQNPLQYNTADLLTRGLESAAIQGAMGSNGLLADIATDMLTDTGAEYIANKAGGMSNVEASNRAFGSGLANIALDVGVNAAPDIVDGIVERRLQRLRNQIPTVEDEVIENAARQADEIPTMDPAELAKQNEIDVNAKVDNVNQAVDEINDLAEQAPNISEESPAQPIEQAVRDTHDVENSASNIIPATTRENYVPHSRQGEAPAFDMPEYRADYSKGIAENVKSLEMPNDVRGYVDSKVKTLDDIFDRIDNAQTKEELDGLYKELNDTVKDLDDTLKDSAQARLIPKRTFDDNTKSFVNAIKGMTINVPDNVRAELPNQTLKQLEARLHFYGDGQNINVHLRKNSGIGIDSVFEDIDAATGHALSSFMEQNGLNPDVTENQLKGILEYADYLKETQNSTKVMDYTGGIFDDYVLEAKRRINARSQALFDARKATKNVSASTEDMPSPTNMTDNTVPASTVVDETPAPSMTSTDVPPTEDKYTSTFRTHNEGNFNLTDEELNNKWFNTKNENFQVIKGDRGADAEKAARNLETDYDGTVNNLLNKPTNQFYSPQEVDEGFMAFNNEVNAGRESGDFSKAADIMYHLTRDAHEKGAGLQAYVAWKKNTPAGVLLDANESVRTMAEDVAGKNYVKNLDVLSEKIAEISNSNLPFEEQVKQVDALMKEMQSKGYKNGVDGFDQMRKLLETGNPVDTVAVREVLYEANKLPNLSAETQAKILSIAQEMYGKDLTHRERQQFINQINIILSNEKHWTLKDKAIELAHILMLSGSRTHIRNFIANVGMLPQEALARKISAVGQNAYKFFKDPNYKPTQAFHVGKEAQELARQGFEAQGGATGIVEGVADKFKNRLAEAIGGNYMFNSGNGNVLSRVNAFATDKIPSLEKFEDALNELMGKGLKKIGSEDAYANMDSNISLLENYRQFIYGSLSGLEDDPFVKRNFEDRLASYIQAQGIKNLDEIPQEAYDLARAEALKATFKDDNAVTQLFQKIKAMPVVGEVLLPFSKTPANLLARSIDYSPIGIARSIYGMINKNSRFAKETVGEAIDELAKGIGGSGTGLLAMWLYSKGVLTGKKDDNADVANYMANQGWQEYSISTKGIADLINSYLGTDLDFGDDYVAFDWMQPLTTDIIAAQALWDELKDGQRITDKTADEIWNKVKAIGGTYIDTLLEQSTMQNVAKLFNNEYSEGGAGSNFIDNVIQLPTRYTSGAINDIAKLADDTKREYYSKNKPIDTLKNMMMSKIPVLSEKLPAKYDIFGNEMTRNDSKGQKWVNTLLNPASTTHRSTNEMYDYINSANAARDKGADKNVDNTTQYTPTKISRTFDLSNGAKYDMDNKQFSEASRISGETRNELLNLVQNNEAYKSLSADNRRILLDTLDKVAVSNGYTSVNSNARVSDEVAELLSQYKEGDKDNLITNLSADIEAKYNPYGLSKENYNKLKEAGEDLTRFEGYGDILGQYGVEDNQDYETAYLRGGKEALAQEIRYESALKDYDISKSGEAYSAWLNGGVPALEDLAELKHALSDVGLSDSGAAREAYADGGLEGLENLANTRQAAIDLGFTNSDGSVNMDAYNKVVGVIGDDPNNISKYVNFWNSMQEGEYTKLEQYIPRLEAMPGLTAEQKGQFAYLYNKSKLSDSALKALGEDGDNYERYWYYRLLQQAPDRNSKKGVDDNDRILEMYSWDPDYNWNNWEYFDFFIGNGLKY